MSNEKSKKSLLRRIIKWSSITLVLLLIILVSLPFLFKDQIVQLVKDEINHRLHAEVEFEDVDLSLISTFPQFHLTITNLVVGGTEHFKETNLIELEKLDVELDLWSALFEEKMGITSIEFIKPNINVIVLKNGVANYDITKPSEQEENTSEEGSSSFELHLEHYAIYEGAISYDDQTMGMRFSSDHFNHIGNAKLNDIIGLETTTDLKNIEFSYDGVSYLTQSVCDIECNLDIELKEELMKFTFKENEASINTFPLHFDGWLSMDSEKMDMDIDYISPSTSFGSILSIIPSIYTSEFSSIKTDGNVDFHGNVKGVYSESSMPGFDITLNVDKAWLQYPNLPQKVKNINVHFNAEREAGPNLDNLILNLDMLQAAISKNTVDANFHLKNLMSDPYVDGSLISLVDFSTLKKAIPFEKEEKLQGKLHTDIKMKGKASSLENENYQDFLLSGGLEISKINYSAAESLPIRVDSAALTFNPENLTIKTFLFNYGTSDFQVEGTIDHHLEYFLSDGIIHGNIITKSDLIDSDEMMSAYAYEESSSESEGVSDQVEGSYIYPVPENMEVSFGTNVQKLIYDSLPIENIQGQIIIKNEIATLDHLKMRAMKGTIELNGNYLADSTDTALIDMFANISNVSITEAGLYMSSMSELVPLAEYCTGKFSTDLKFDSKFDHNLEPVYETLSGDGKLRTHDVSIKGLPIFSKLGAEFGLKIPSEQKIKNLLITYRFKDGKLWVDPYQTKLFDINTTIEGTTAYDGAIDYTFDMSIPNKLIPKQVTAALNQAMTALSYDKEQSSKNLPVKVLVTGTVIDPIISTDLKNQLGNLKDNAVDAALDKLEGEAKKILESAKVKADQLLAEAKKQADEIRKKGKEGAEAIRKQGKSGKDKAISEAKKAADAVRNEGYKQADNLIKQAKNPIEKKLAEKAAEKLRKETDLKAKQLESEGEKKGNKIEAESNKQAQKVEDEANNKANAIESNAQTEADKIISEAEKKVDNIND